MKKMMVQLRRQEALAVEVNCLLKNYDFPLFYAN